MEHALRTYSLLGIRGWILSHLLPWPHPGDGCCFPTTWASRYREGSAPVLWVMGGPTTYEGLHIPCEYLCQVVPHSIANKNHMTREERPQKKDGAFPHLSCFMNKGVFMFLFCSGPVNYVSHLSRCDSVLFVKNTLSFSFTTCILNIFEIHLYVKYLKMHDSSIALIYNLHSNVDACSLLSPIMCIHSLLPPECPEWHEGNIFILILQRNK